MREVHVRARERREGSTRRREKRGMGGCARENQRDGDNFFFLVVGRISCERERSGGMERDCVTKRGERERGERRDRREERGERGEKILSTRVRISFARKREERERSRGMERDCEREKENERGKRDEREALSGKERGKRCCGG